MVLISINVLVVRKLDMKLKFFLVMIVVVDRFMKVMVVNVSVWVMI